MSKSKDSKSVYLQPAKALDKKIAYIEQIIGKSDDLVQRPFSFGSDHTIPASLLYIDA
ncbi:hypothetical protein JCM19047_3812 [Bacillus sp. JCM 19047]|nr:hypothetical protein JCM19047_3812 [Bacillus sp. JCM 19047]